MIIAGIDPSLSCTAIVIGSGPSNVKEFTVQRGPQGLSVWAKFQRYEGIAGDVSEILKAENVERIFIEGYAFASDFNVTKMAEFGGVLRLYLLDIDKRLREVAPTQLKSFATGKGNAKKPAVVAAVRNRWGFDTDSHDVADAYTLYRIGLAVEGIVQPSTITEASIVSAIEAGPQPKPSKPRRKKAAKPKPPELFPPNF